MCHFRNNRRIPDTRLQQITILPFIGFLKNISQTRFRVPLKILFAPFTELLANLMVVIHSLQCYVLNNLIAGSMLQYCT